MTAALGRQSKIPIQNKVVSQQYITSIKVLAIPLERLEYSILGHEAAQATIYQSDKPRFLALKNQF
jgi:hypothetical protein